MEKNIFAALLEKIFSSAGKSNVSEAQEISGEDKVMPTTASATDSSPNAVNRLCASIAQGAAFVFDFTEIDNVTIPKGMICINHARIDNEIGYTTLSNGNPEAKPGAKTGGYSIRLSDEIEKAASGQRITLNVIARAAGTEHSRFAVAYSTNDVGNSGWKWFDAQKNWSIHTIEYSVPTMKKALGDYIGILPDSEGQPGTEFCFVALHIVQN